MVHACLFTQTLLRARRRLADLLELSARRSSSLPSRHPKCRSGPRHQDQDLTVQVQVRVRRALLVSLSLLLRRLGKGALEVVNLSEHILWMRGAPIYQRDLLHVLVATLLSLRS